MPEISVVVPVYNAEKSLRRCVESIVLGEQQDVEVILLEDCSTDGSWALCRELAEEYPQVVCLQNDRNRGVSYTRNRGLDTATGSYLLFVDSDDWVSRSYVKTMIDAAKENPGKLIVCGYTLLDRTSHARRDYGIFDTPLLTRPDFRRLSAEVMLQQLWNKVFPVEAIRKAGIRFDETICIGEDYKFVMDMIEALDVQECVIIQQPLYYYIRWGGGSLMDQWSQRETYEDALGRAVRLETLCGGDRSGLEQFKTAYAYRIIWDTDWPRKQKQSMVRKILGTSRGSWFYCRQRLISLRSRIHRRIQAPAVRKQQEAQKQCELATKNRIEEAAAAFRKQELVIISQNCIGAVFTHDMGQSFRSPTVNLYFPAGDFIKFVNGLEHYLDFELKMTWGEEYPLGMLDDVEIHFVHYDNCKQAREAWERRKTRVDLSKILVLSTDRDGFNETLFEQWKAIPYPKLLFTACKAYADHEDVLYFPEHEPLGCVPDLIPKREFYKDHVLMEKVNAS